MTIFACNAGFTVNNTRRTVKFKSDVNLPDCFASLRIDAAQQVVSIANVETVFGGAERVLKHFAILQASTQLASHRFEGVDVIADGCDEDIVSGFHSSPGT